MNRFHVYLVMFLLLMVAISAWLVHDVATEGEITPNDEFFELSIGEAPRIDGDTWTLEVVGLVDQNLVLSLEEIRAMPSTEVTATLKCVEGPSGTAVWKGVRLGHVLDLAGVMDGAEEVVSYASDGYDSSLTLEDAYEDDVLLCYEMNGEDLPREQGYPLKLVVPGKAGYKWVKWIYRVEVVDYDHKGYWESRGWDDEADLTPLSQWVPHAALLTLAAFLGGLAAIGGLRFSNETGFWRDLPAWFSRSNHQLISWAYLLVLYPAFGYWVAATLLRRGDVFYSSHGILGMVAVTCATVGLVTGVALARGREGVRSAHLSFNLLGYLFLIATIGLGLVRI